MLVLNKNWQSWHVLLPDEGEDEECWDEVVGLIVEQVVHHTVPPLVRLADVWNLKPAQLSDHYWPPLLIPCLSSLIPTISPITVNINYLETDHLDSPRMNSSRLRRGAISRSFNGILNNFHLSPSLFCQFCKLATSLIDGKVVRIYMFSQFLTAWI